MKPLKVKLIPSTPHPYGKVKISVTMPKQNMLDRLENLGYSERDIDLVVAEIL
jgi:hypothetical protein